MKIRDGFLLRRVAGNYVAMAVGANCLDFNGMLTLNESGAFLWGRLEKGTDREELVSALLDEYEVTAEAASADVDIFLSKLEAAGCLSV